MRDYPKAEENNDFESRVGSFYDSIQLQQNVSFWASITGSAVGLVALVIALLAFLEDPDNLTVSAVLAIGGVVSELISVLFFYLHNQSTNQLLRGFEKLIKFQDTQLAIDLVQKMDPKHHDYMYNNIVNVLLLRNEPDRELSPELVRALRDRTGT